MDNKTRSAFAPQLYIKSGVTNIEFYTKAFGAIELKRWTNEDGGIHAAELSINDAIFYVHEEVLKAGSFSPEKYNGITASIGQFVSDADRFMDKAITEGTIKISAAQDHEYGYRQGIIKDPFGHTWIIETKRS